MFKWTYDYVDGTLNGVRKGIIGVEVCNYDDKINVWKNSSDSDYFSVDIPLQNVVEINYYKATENTKANKGTYAAVGALVFGALMLTPAAPFIAASSVGAGVLTKLTAGLIGGAIYGGGAGVLHNLAKNLHHENIFMISYLEENDPENLKVIILEHKKMFLKDAMQFFDELMAQDKVTPKADFVKAFVEAQESNRGAYIYTLGHTDHGKTTLTNAITNIFPLQDGAGNGAMKSAYTKYVEYATKNRHYNHLDLDNRVDIVKNFISDPNQADGAILVVAATDSVMSQTREQVYLAKAVGIKNIVVFLNKCDIVIDEEMLDLVEMEIRGLFDEYGFSGDDVPIIRGSATEAIKNPNGTWGNSIVDLMDAVDNHVTLSDHKVSSRPNDKFPAIIYVCTENEGGRSKPIFNGYRPQLYVGSTDVTCAISLPSGVELCMPGDFITVDIELFGSLAVRQGDVFELREGAKVIGIGKAISVPNLNFVMDIAEVKIIKGIGAVVKGTVGMGTINLNDKVYLTAVNPVKAIVSKINDTWESATDGDKVELLLKDIQKRDFDGAYFICKAKSLPSNLPLSAWEVYCEYSEEAMEHFFDNNSPPSYNITEETAPTPVAVETPANTSSVADEILKFKSLLDMGVLTQEEFDQKKKQLLNL